MRSLYKRARAAGYKLWKVRENSKWFAEFGPYSLIDANTNCIIIKGLDADGVIEQLAD